MKHPIRVLLLASMLFLLAGVTSAEDNAEQNAAPLYLALYEDERYTAVDWQAVEEACTDVVFADVWVPAPDLLSLLRDQEFFFQCKKIAAIERSDFGLDYAEGPKLDMRHIRPMQALSNLFLADARTKFDRGEVESGIESLTAAIEVAGHTENDLTLISAVIRIRIITRVMFIADKVHPEEWTLKSIKDYIEIMQSFGGEDPFGIRRAILNDSVSEAAWLIRMSGSPGGIEQVLDRVTPASADTDDDSDSKRKLLMNKINRAGGLVHCAALYEPMGNAQVFALDSEDPMSQFRKLGRQIDDGEFGPLGEFLVPPAAKLLTGERDCQKILEFNQMTISVKLFELEDAEEHPPTDSR